MRKELLTSYVETEKIAKKEKEVSSVKKSLRSLFLQEYGRRASKEFKAPANDVEGRNVG